MEQIGNQYVDGGIFFFQVCTSKSLWPIFKMSSVRFLSFLLSASCSQLPRFSWCALFLLALLLRREKSIGFISSLKNEVGLSWWGDEVTKSHLSFSMRRNELLEAGLGFNCLLLNRGEGSQSQSTDWRWFYWNIDSSYLYAGDDRKYCFWLNCLNQHSLYFVFSGTWNFLSKLSVNRITIHPDARAKNKKSTWFTIPHNLIREPIRKSHHLLTKAGHFSPSPVRISPIPATTITHLETDKAFSVFSWFSLFSSKVLCPSSSSSVGSLNLMIPLELSIDNWINPLLQKHVTQKLTSLK